MKKRDLIQDFILTHYSEPLKRKMYFSSNMRYYLEACALEATMSVLGFIVE